MYNNFSSDYIAVAESKTESGILFACQTSIPFQIGCFEKFPRPDWISQVKKTLICFHKTRALQSLAISKSV